MVKSDMSKFKTVTKYLFIILTCASVVLMAACVIAGIAIYRSRPERKTASVWSQGSKTRYAHVAAYAKGARANGASSPLSYVYDGSSLSINDIDSIRASLQGIVDTAFRPKRGSKDKTIKTPEWTDCYSSCLTGTVNSGNLGSGKTYEADIYAVGGSFAVMHPFEFMSGGFLSPDTTDKYQVVLNDEASWSMFRSYDVIGKRIGILGKDYTVIGVVREHEDKKARVYISFDCLKEYCSGLDHPVVPAVMSYEAILPEQSSKSAKFDLAGAVPGYNNSSPSFRVVRVTGRYNVFNTLKSESPEGFELPFWEEGAVKAEADIKMAAVAFVFGMVMLIGLLIGKASSAKS
jgi:hypothetical protein